MLYFAIFCLFRRSFLQKNWLFQLKAVPLLSLKPAKPLTMLKCAGRFVLLWHIIQRLPLGVLTRIYDNIRSNQIRKKTAQEFSLGVPVFNSWMTIITFARNNWSHHARVWNRTIQLYKTGEDGKQHILARFDWKKRPNNRKIEFELKIIAFLLYIFYVWTVL